MSWERAVTYERDLLEIKSASRGIFGVPVEVTPRAIQALTSAFEHMSVLGNDIGRFSDFECFRQVLASSPGLADAFLRQSHSFAPLLTTGGQSPRISRFQRFGSPKKLLTDIFVSRFPFESGLHPAGDNVRSTGRLTEVDLALASLQAGRRSVLPNKTASTLLKAVGLFNDGYPTERSDRYLEKLETQLRSATTIDEAHAEQQVVLYLDSNERIRLSMFGANTVGELDERLSGCRTFIFRGGVLQPARSNALFSADSIEELEDLMNSRYTLEQDFQKFFERHPEFLKTFDYGKIHAQPILYKDDGSRLIPDFFLEQTDSGWHAIAELKRVDAHLVIRKKNRVYFAQWVHDAIAQLQYYREWFESSKNREIFEQTQKISTRIYKPKMVLIAGRNHDFIDDVERCSLLSAQDANLAVWTYDAVLHRAKKYREFAQGV